LGTFRQMAYWLAIVDERSFTRAAARLHVSGGLDAARKAVPRADARPARQHPPRDATVIA